MREMGRRRRNLLLGGATACAALALAFTCAAGILLSGCLDRERPRNAVLIVLDTLRADRLSAYGNPRETSPALDRLARDGVLFETVVTNTPWTLPAMAGLLSGQYPTAAVFDRGLHISLVENLRDAGWNTAAFTEGGFASAKFGLDRGFDRYSEQEGGVGAIEGIEKTFEEAIQWLAESGERPFFLLLHTYEPHIPYRRRMFAEALDPGRFGPSYEWEDMGEVTATAPITREELDYVRALYDGGVQESDRHVGELLDALVALDLADETLLVVTADHGEDLGERRLSPGGHGHAVYDEQVLVPLILRDPTRDYPVKRVSAQVRTVDILPTVLEILGVARPPGGHGRSLVPLMTGEERVDRLAWIEIPYHHVLSPDVIRAVRTGTHKLVVTRDSADRPEGPQIELYDLRADPGERENLGLHERLRKPKLMRRLGRLAAELDAHGAPDFSPMSPAPDPALEERLRELGYVAGPGAERGSEPESAGAPPLSLR